MFCWAIRDGVSNATATTRLFMGGAPQRSERNRVRTALRPRRRDCDPNGAFAAGGVACHGGRLRRLMSPRPTPMNPLAPAVAALLSAATLLAQGVLHYKFDEHCSSEVVNFAAGSAIGNATIVTTLAGGVAAARTSGQFDGALTGTTTVPAGTTYLNTGWAPSTLSGSFSFSMWIRNTPGNPTAIPFGYLFGATGSNFRLFTGSSGFLFLSSVPGSATSNVNLTS